MDKAEKGYNVFFNPYMGIGGNDATPRGAMNEACPDWMDLPWNRPANGMLTKLTGELDGIPLDVNHVVNKPNVVNRVNRPYPNTDKRRAYQREYMRKRRAEKRT